MTDKTMCSRDYVPTREGLSLFFLLCLWAATRVLLEWAFREWLFFSPRHLGNHTPFSGGGCWVYSCFLKLPNSDMNDRIVSVHTCSFACVYTTRGTRHYQILHKLTWESKKITTLIPSGARLEFESQTIHVEGWCLNHQAIVSLLKVWFGEIWGAFQG